MSYKRYLEEAKEEIKKSYLQYLFTAVFMFIFGWILFNIWMATDCDTEMECFAVWFDIFLLLIADLGFVIYKRRCEDNLKSLRVRVLTAYVLLINCVVFVLPALSALFDCVTGINY